MDKAGRFPGDRPLFGRAHARLRAETQSLHGALDARLAPSTLIEREGYIRYLLMNWPCASIELALSAAGVDQILPDWDRRQRRGVLGKDLNALGSSPAALPALAIDHDIGAILGWSYVLEGSRLGAAQILKMVEAAEEPQIRVATQFLRHGRDEDFWGSFKLALSQIDEDDSAIAKACAAASSAFGCFIEGAPRDRRGRDE